VKSENGTKKRPTSRKRSSNWARGNAVSSRKKSRRENGDEEEGGEDRHSIDETSNDVPSSVSVSSENHTAEPASESVRFDKDGLAKVQKNLVGATDGFNVERLERVFSQIHEIVLSVRNVADRSFLHQTIASNVIDRLKAAVGKPK
jgi:hypothetical protein